MIQLDDSDPKIWNEDAYNRYSNIITEQIQNFFTTPDFPIYHYTSASSLCSILTQQKLWFTKWNSLNDPTEFKLIHDIIQDELNQYKDDKKFFRMIQDYNSFDIFLKNNGENWNTEHNIFIMSGTRKRDALNMWTCYTKSAQTDGYAIKFDCEPYTNPENNTTIYLTEVIYDREEQNRIIRHFLEELHKAYIDDNLAQHGVDDRDLIMAYLFDLVILNIGCRFKDSAYREEQEIRAIFHIPEGNEEKIQYRTSNGIIIPYVPIGLNTNAVREICISPSLKNKAAIPGIRSIKNALNYNFKIVQSEIPFRCI